jgi:hypothetical protein|tara:strand:+ start:87 stop:503 length:417 start_codon:yes stop_codon:yes gene_type:complete
MKDEISNSLGLKPLNDVLEVTPNKVPVIHATLSVENKLDRDYEYARTNFYNVIEAGTEALEEMLQVAKSSEHPRAYEVVATIMKTLVDSNKELVAMSSKKVKEDEIVTDSSKAVTNNNVFLGSTAELQQLLKDMRSNE